MLSHPFGRRGDRMDGARRFHLGFWREQEEKQRQVLRLRGEQKTLPASLRMTIVLNRNQSNKNYARARWRMGCVSALAVRYASIEAAALRPSAMAQTTRDWPRRMSPAAKMPSTEVM